MADQPFCVALIALLGQQKVAVPGSPAYTASLGSYFSQQEAAVQPACIVLPETASDVSTAVVALQHPEDGQRSSFAVRSRGHTAWSGAANIADGVVIDLRGLDAIELSPDQSTVAVGVGASWDMVYAKLDPLGLSVNGGRSAGVGELGAGQDRYTFFLLLMIYYGKGSGASPSAVASLTFHLVMAGPATRSPTTRLSSRMERLSTPIRVPTPIYSRLSKVETITLASSPRSN